MEQRSITVFCLIDDYLKLADIRDDVRAKISNSEILLIGYLAVNDFNGNYYKAHGYTQDMKLVKSIDYTRFLRRLLKIRHVVEKIFLFLGEIFKRLEGLAIYSVDSFPVEICQIPRVRCVRLWSDESLRGYNSSKGKYFYGIKVHMVVTTNKEPVMFYISKGSTHDIKAGYEYLPYLPKDSIVIGDKGYISQKLERFLKNFDITLLPIYRKNMQLTYAEEQQKGRIRKGVETAFSVITSKFGKVIKATTLGGFLTKLKLFIIAYSIDCFLKLSDDNQKLLFN